MIRRQTIAINEHAAYVRDTGCVVVDGVVVELTVREEELFELLLTRPKVTLKWAHACASMGVAEDSVRHYVKGLRWKLGTRAVRSHHGVGISLQPQFVGSARFRLVRTRTAS